MYGAHMYVPHMRVPQKNKCQIFLVSLQVDIFLHHIVFPFRIRNKEDQIYNHLSSYHLAIHISICILHLSPPSIYHLSTILSYIHLFICLPIYSYIPPIYTSMYILSIHPSIHSSHPIRNFTKIFAETQL